MSTVKFGELCHSIPAVFKEQIPVNPKERYAAIVASFVARHLYNLRHDYSTAHDITVDEFAARVGVSKKHLYALERGEGSPTVATLNKILQACDTDLVEFFHRLITHAKLADIEAKSAEDERIVSLLVEALSNARARVVVEGAAASVAAFFASEDDQ